MDIANLFQRHKAAVMKLFQYKPKYTVTRPITSKWFQILFPVVLAIWLVVATAISIATVGYELVPFFSTSYNASNVLWYERFIHPQRLRPQTISCQPSVIQINDGVYTNITGLVQYTLLDYLTPSNSTPVNGMIYQNTVLEDCSVVLANVIQTAADYIQDQTWVTCNTSAAQSFAIQTSRQDLGLPVNGGPFNWEAAILHGDIPSLWFRIATAVANIFFPAGQMSVLLPSVALNGFSSIRIAFYGSTLDGQTNTPAGDTWTLYLFYTPAASIKEKVISITFLPNLEIDTTRTSLNDLNEANTILAPTILAVQEIVGNNTIDIWKLFNWLFVSIYWVLLADFGHIAPTTYPYTASPLWEGYSDYSNPTRYPPTNNIFYNETIYETYFSYLQDTILPIFESQYNLTFPLPSIPFNRVQPVAMTFVRSYSCTERQLKPIGSLFISVIVAVYTLMVGAYGFSIWVAGLCQEAKYGKFRTVDCERCDILLETLNNAGQTEGDNETGNRCKRCEMITRILKDDPRKTENDGNMGETDSAAEVQGGEDTVEPSATDSLIPETQ